MNSIFGNKPIIITPKEIYGIPLNSFGLYFNFLNEKVVVLFDNTSVYFDIFDTKNKIFDQVNYCFCTIIKNLPVSELRFNTTIQNYFLNNSSKKFRIDLTINGKDFNENLMKGYGYTTMKNILKNQKNEEIKSSSSSTSLSVAPKSTDNDVELEEEFFLDSSIINCSIIDCSNIENDKIKIDKSKFHYMEIFEKDSSYELYLPESLSESTTESSNSFYEFDEFGDSVETFFDQEEKIKKVKREAVVKNKEKIDDVTRTSFSNIPIPPLTFSKNFFRTNFKLCEENIFNQIMNYEEYFAFNSIKKYYYITPNLKDITENDISNLDFASTNIFLFKKDIPNNGVLLKYQQAEKAYELELENKDFDFCKQLSSCLIKAMRDSIPINGKKMKLIVIKNKNFPLILTPRKIELTLRGVDFFEKKNV